MSLTQTEIEDLRIRIRRVRRHAEILASQYPDKDSEELVEVLGDCQRLAALPILTDRIDARRRR